MPGTDEAPDQRVDQVVEKVTARPSVDAPREEVQRHAAEAVADLADAPVQTFTPLLAENRVVDELHHSRGGREQASARAEEGAITGADDGAP